MNGLLENKNNFFLKEEVGLKNKGSALKSVGSKATYCTIGVITCKFSLHHEAATTKRN